MSEAGTNTLINGVPKPIYDAVAGGALNAKRVQAKAQLAVEKPVIPFFSTVPRLKSDKTKDVLVFSFAKPSSIGEISLELPEIGCKFELWYVNRAGKEIPINQTNLQQVAGEVADGNRNRWQTFSFITYPIVATKVVVKLSRTLANGSDDVSTSLYLRNLSIKRNVYTRNDALYPLDSTFDSLGNYVTKTVREWDPQKAMDDNEYTFWQSSPQPTPEAVVCLYVDCRDKDGNAQLIDRLWLDPVFADQQINMYYTADDTYGRPRLSFDRAVESKRVNAIWSPDRGMKVWDAINTAELAYPLFPADKKNSFQACFTWKYEESTTAEFELFSLSSTGTRVRFNPLTKNLTVEVEGTVAGSFLTDFAIGVERNVKIDFSVANGKTTVSVSTDKTAKKTLPTVVSKVCPQNALSIKKSYGTFKYFLLRDGLLPGTDDFLTQPELFITPDPVLEDEMGNLPESTLDLVYFAADWVNYEQPRSKLDQEFYLSKIWNPIWADWIVKRGMYYLPQPRLAKFFKLEFTNLTEMPYPVWEEDVKTYYQSFPVDVTKTLVDIATKTQTNKKVTTTINKVTTSTTTINNKVTGSSVSKSQSTNAVSSMSSAVTYNSQRPDIQITVGKGVLTADVPRTFDKPVETSIKREVAVGPIYRGTSVVSNTTTSFTSSQKNIISTTTKKVAVDAYYKVVKGDYLIKIAAKYGVKWWDIYMANYPWIQQDPRIKLLPKRSAGWWIFPGQVIRIPGSVMKTITTTKVDVEKKKSNTAITTRVQTDTSTQTTTTTTTTRLRFTTSSIHRYDVKSIERDSALAYFAGIREMKLYKVNWLQATDREEFRIERFDDDSVESKSKVNLNLDLGTAHPIALPATLTTNTMPSLSRYRKVELSAIQRQPSQLRFLPNAMTIKNGLLSDSNLNYEGVRAYGVGGNASLLSKLKNDLTAAEMGISQAQADLDQYKKTGPTVWDDPSFESGYGPAGRELKGSSNGTITRVQENASDGSWSLKYTGSGSGNSCYTMYNTTPVVAGRTYSISLSVYTDTAPAFYFNARYRDSSQTLMPGSVTQRVALTPNSRTNWETTFTVPAGAAELYSWFGFYSGDNTADNAGKSAWLDNIRLVDITDKMNAITTATTNRDAVNTKITNASNDKTTTVLSTPTSTIDSPWKAVRAVAKVNIPSEVTSPVNLRLKSSSGKKFEQTFRPNRGEWTLLSTEFFTAADTGMWTVEVECGQDFYISQAGVDFSTIQYEISNDGGSTYFDVSNLANRSGGSFVFPDLGNQLKLRVTMNRMNDYVYSFSTIPYYMIES